MPLHPYLGVSGGHVTVSLRHLSFAVVCVSRTSRQICGSLPKRVHLDALSFAPMTRMGRRWERRAWRERPHATSLPKQPTDCGPRSRPLFVEPDTLHTPAIEQTVHHDGEPL